ncbi:MAG: MMPL family transporter [Paludibacteraceae bacterium]|nr:MMPL family transporter [Paludibacteraceae bacterium]
MKTLHHILLLAATLLFAAVCVWLIPRVNVNSDMTQYLPDGSAMKQGLEIMTSEFDASEVQVPNVKVMFEGLDETQRKDVAAQLAFYEDIKSINYVTTADEQYTLYRMLVPESVDLKQLGCTIRENFENSFDDGKEHAIVVETGQDGATPSFVVIVVAVLVVILILLIMAKSWLDPVILLFAMGIAVVMNIGTNAFLPNVSITTNYIGSILQLVLSLDYAVVLLNRYRQELSDSCSITESVNRALCSSFRPIMSSALTTIVGMLMLGFMRLKIGLDMGVVLAKGVICSLVCTFTMLPAIIILCHNALQRTTKRVFIIPTDRLSRFATGHKISLTVFAMVLFGTSLYFSQRTDIYFSTNGESQIEKIFPEPNVTVMLYDTRDEKEIIKVAEQIAQDSAVKSIISYPTLLKQQYPAEGMSDYIHRLSVEMADFAPPIDEGQMELLTPEVMRMLYYLRSKSGDDLKVDFPSLMTFVRDSCLDNPMFADIIDSNIRNQMALLDVMLEQTDDNEDDEEDIVPERREKAETVAEVSQPAPAPKPVSKPAPKPVLAAESHDNAKAAETDDKVAVIDFFAKFHALYNTDETYQLTRLTDTVALNERMNPRQMSAFIGSTVSQTKMVYSFKDDGRKMTPITYVNFLSDDLFNRKALQSMVSESQKQELRSRARLMNYAVADSRITPVEMSTLLAQLGYPVSEERIRAIANPRAAVQVKQIKDEVAQTTPAVAVVEQPSQEEQALLAQAAAERDRIAKKKAQEKKRADRQAAKMDEMLHSNRTYTAAEMTYNFHCLGETINPIFVELLYNYYGSFNDYNDSLTMSLEQMLTYVADTMLYDRRFENFLDDNSRQLIMSTRNQIAGSIGMLSNDSHSIMVVQTTLPDESADTYAFVNKVQTVADAELEHPYYLIGESVMFSEMKNGFNHEMLVVTILTALAIFLIVAISFRSLVVPTILVLMVMTAVYVNVIYSGIVRGDMLYLAYLVTQSILMGATIDYGILYTNYYKENRLSMTKREAAREAYHGAIGTMMTSGLILVLGPGVMAILVDDVTIAAIVGSIAIGALVAILLIMLVLPGVLVACDKLVINGIFGRRNK